MDRVEDRTGLEASKLPYHSPRIEYLGSVAEITAAGNGACDPADSSTGYGAGAHS